LSVCLFSRTISKTTAARLTKLDTEMSHLKSCKVANPFIFGSKVKGQGHDAQKVPALVFAL